VLETPRKIYRNLKNAPLASRLHIVRRINRVFPPEGKRLVAITFDDGPCAGPARPSSVAVTTMILDTLKEFDAKGTFDVIGSTESKYPDKKGKNGGPYWNGVSFDHYPEYGEDKLAGVLNQKDLTKRIAGEGHELSNHGYTHGAFGPCKYPYWHRQFLPNYNAVLNDLQMLHDLVRDVVGIEMRFGRPAHYIDKIKGGKDAYDAYADMGYLYLGASFDGGGWQASAGDFETDIQRMILPLKDALTKDPDSLNGQIIFHKDGYNMSSEAPAPHGLKHQLEILRNYGYTVVTVSELLKLSPFTDIGSTHPVWKAAVSLVQNGYPVVYADNCVRPDRDLTFDGLRTMCSCGKANIPKIQSSLADLVYLIDTKRTMDKLELAPEPGFFEKRRPVVLRNLTLACKTYIDNMPIGEEESLKRHGLVLKRSQGDGNLVVKRGQALALMSAALLGV
jgi:peptidoglycan/xylan/chitin deacetylase (PgdA/CDA1 family)